MWQRIIRRNPPRMSPSNIGSTPTLFPSSSDLLNHPLPHHLPLPHPGRHQTVSNLSRVSIHYTCINSSNMNAFSARFSHHFYINTVIGGILSPSVPPNVENPSTAPTKSIATTTPPPAPWLALFAPVPCLSLHATPFLPPLRLSIRDSTSSWGPHEPAVPYETT